MFSTFLAWVVFVITSFYLACLVITILDEEYINPEKTKLNRAIEMYYGYKTTYWNYKTYTLVTVWVVSGIYLFG